MKYGEAVAIVIVSYNSGNTVIKTLNSILEQDYPAIELIISDDCSSDNTADLINNWLLQHKKRFVKSLFLEQKKNLGISENANKAYAHAESEWIKGLAADDLLLPETISDNVRFVIQNSISTVLFSNVVPFCDVDNKKKYLKIDWEERWYIHNFAQKKANKQYKCLIKRDILCSPTLFINTKLFKKEGGFDERYRNLEDWTLKIKLTRNGHKIYYLNLDTVFYRLENSISRSDINMLRENHIREVNQVKQELCYPNIPKYHIVYYYEEILIRIKNHILLSVMKNTRNACSETVNVLFNILLPRKWRKIYFKVLKIKC